MYNMITCIDNVTDHILVHVNIWFRIELMNLLLSQASGEKWHIHLPLLCPAGT
jgi:hypothetical protein